MSLGLGPQVLEPGIITLTKLALTLKAALMVETLKTKQCINLRSETRFQYIKGMDKKRPGTDMFGLMCCCCFCFLERKLMESDNMFWAAMKSFCQGHNIFMLWPHDLMLMKLHHFFVAKS